MGVFWNGKCRSKARLDGKLAVVTGCNIGIGKFTVLDLYRRGAHVIMACRDLQKAKDARDWVHSQCEKQNGLGQLSVCRLDLSSLASVRECARNILDQHSNIHLLINNAGVMMCPRTLSEDGYELQFATNHLGHFLFTLLLLPRILTSAPARIVNVASRAHSWHNSIEFDDINMEKNYSPHKAYGRSKLSNILFTRELAKRLQGTGVTTYSLHPGVVNTELTRHIDKTIFPGLSWLFHNVCYFFTKSPEQGAQTTLHCALDERLADESGLYYDDCQVTTPSAAARNDDLAKELWNTSLDLVNLTPSPPFGKN